MQLFTRLDEHTGKMLLIKNEVCAVKSEGNIFQVLYVLYYKDRLFCKLLNIYFPSRLPNIFTFAEGFALSLCGCKPASSVL